MRMKNNQTHKRAEDENENYNFSKTAVLSFPALTFQIKVRVVAHKIVLHRRAVPLGEVMVIQKARCMFPSDTTSPHCRP